MKVYLCEANIPVKASRFEPLGLCTLSGYLKSKGHRTVIFQQFSQSNEEVVRRILEFEPDVVGFSCLDVNLAGSLEMARRIKRARPDVFIAFGGEHPTANPDLAKRAEVDLIVRGEGEITFAEILDALKENRPFDQIPGVAFFDGEKLIVTPPRDRIGDLGALPPPDRDILGKSQYRYYGLTPSDAGISAKQLHVAASYFSRGCPYNCRFCTTPKVWGRRWIARPVSDVVAEVRALADSGINFIYFQDENFITDLELTRRFCNALIEAKTDIRFSCMTRINDVDDDLAALLAEAGLKHVGVGIESVREETLREIQKGLDLAQTAQKVAVLKGHGISVAGLFMIGYPWETREMILGYSKKIKALGLNSIKIQFLVPFAQTALWEEAREKGQILADDPSQNSAEIPVLKNPTLTADDLLGLRKKLYRDFYFSPRFLLRMLIKAATHPAMVPDYLRRFFWFLKKG